jgi:nicotinamide-nucleotide amidase
MFSYPQILALAQKLGERLSQQQKRCAVAESCTGGLLSAMITDIPGSSHWFDRGYITYSNQAKIDMLAVPSTLLETDGAVSESVVTAMAEGALTKASVDMTVAISGIAGPAGGTPLKPVGLVWLAWAARGQPTNAQSYHLIGDRAAVRAQSVCKALEGLINRIKEKE